MENDFDVAYLKNRLYQNLPEMTEEKHEALG
jgi:hypothetical protein